MHEHASAQTIHHLVCRPMRPVLRWLLPLAQTRPGSTAACAWRIVLMSKVYLVHDAYITSFGIYN
jgi:hypothetical protein